ncbi:hypothetical protein BJ165DRAFT_1482239 [Panaeolus papilionaceus]|nr:hypothetical protein BJ165DRAFT_1482239 [Panaeolus papilionaceus]
MMTISFGRVSTRLMAMVMTTTTGSSHAMTRNGWSKILRLGVRRSMRVVSATSIRPSIGSILANCINIPIEIGAWLSLCGLSDCAFNRKRECYLIFASPVHKNTPCR